MKILTISDDGRGLGIAKRIHDEGFDSVLYVDESSENEVGNGVVNKIELQKYLINKSYQPIESTLNMLLDNVKPDLVVVDGYRLGKVMAKLRELGVKVVGSDTWYDTVLEDKDYEDKLLNRVGVGRCVDGGGLKFVVGGVWNGFELSCSWLGVNQSRWLVDGLGCEVPSACNGMVSAHGIQVLGGWWNRMVGLLKKTKFHGFINLSVTLLNNEILVDGFLPTHTFISSFLELYQGSFTELLNCCANGTLPNGKLSNDVSGSVLISVPPFPYAVNESQTVTIEGINEFNLKHIYFIDAQVNKDKVWSSGKGDGAIGYVTAHGRDLGECSRRIDKTLHNLSIPNVQYRTDLYKSCIDTLRELKHLQ
jgi:phosphoribosylamine-glycine ligase